MKLGRLVSSTLATVLAVGLVTAAPAAGAPAEAAPQLDAARTTPANSLRLAWSAVNGAAGYRVQVSTQGSPATVIESSDTRALSWTPSLLHAAANDRIYWRVAAYGSAMTAGDLGAYSDWFVLDLQPPSTPTLVSPAPGATVLYPTAPVFSWTPVAGADSYTITYSTDPGFAAGAATTTAVVAGTTFTPAAPLTHSSAGTKWYWRVGPRFAPAAAPSPDDYVEGSFVHQWADTDSRPTLQPASSPFPGSGKELGALESVTSVRLSWTPVAGASRYHVVLGKNIVTTDNTSVVTEVFHQAETSLTTYVPTVAVPDVGVHWQVIALDAKGAEGAPSAPSSFTKAWGAQSEERNPSSKLVAPTPTFGAASGAEATPVSIGDLELTWEPVPGATFYSVNVTDGTTTLSCRTSSTSATIIGMINQSQKNSDTPVQWRDRLTDVDKCLWDSTASKRIRVGSTYSWTVKAFDYSAGITDKYQGTRIAESAIESAVSERRHFTVVEDEVAKTATAERVVLHPIPEVSVNPVPHLSWEARANAGYYEVEVALNSDFTQRVGWFYTPSRRMQLNGIFANEDTAQPYFVRVRAGSSTNWSSTVVLWPESESEFATWEQDSVDITFPAGAVSTSTSDPSTVLLRWNPIRPSVTESGGHRGYLVTIKQGPAAYTAKVETPFVTAQAFGARPTTSVTTYEKKLSPGTYSWSVAPLDAAGKVGRASSAPQEFTIVSPGPTALGSTVGSGADAQSTTLRWQASHSATSYEVTVTDPANKKTVLPRGGLLQQTAVVVPTPIPGTYSWSVVAVDSNGNRSAASDAGTFAVVLPRPDVLTADGRDFTAETLNLEWVAVPGAAGYRVRLGTNAATVGTAAPATVRGTSFVPTASLVYGQRYYWVVEAYGPAVSGTAPTLDQSAVGTFTISTRPGTPSGLAVAAAGRSITASWNDLTGADRGSLTDPEYVVRHRVARTDGGTNPWVELPAVRGLLSRQLTGLPVATTYEFQVAARNSHGTSPWSAMKSASTANVPAVVESLSATAQLGGIRVTWARPRSHGGSPVTSYSVEYRLAGGSWVSSGQTSTSLTLAGLAGGRNYEVRVSAVNAVGSGPVAATSVTTLALPGTARSVKVARGNTKAKVTWTAPASTGGSPITGYTIEMRTLSGKKWSTWARKTSTTGARTASITGLKNGTRYQVRVIAQTKLGKGAASSAVQFVPAGKPLATSIKVTSSKKRNVKVTWKAAASNGSKVTGYRVQYSANGKKWKTMKTSKSSARSYTWKKGKSKKTAYFRVQAKNALGWGTVSRTARVTVR